MQGGSKKAIGLAVTIFLFVTAVLMIANYARTSQDCGLSNSRLPTSANFVSTTTKWKRSQVVIGEAVAAQALSHTELTPVQRHKLAVITLIVGMVESNLTNVAVKLDHTSLGVHQQQDWWGTAEQRLNVTESTELLISGGAILPGGYNGHPDGSEPGILDLKGWETMAPGEVAWRVQQPAAQYRYRYATRIPDAEAFLKNGHLVNQVALLEPAALTKSADCGPTSDLPAVLVAGTSSGGWRVPLDKGYVVTSGFNPHRLHPLLHTIRPHNGVDLAVAAGTPVYAAKAGIVEKAEPNEGSGNYIALTHANDGDTTVESSYSHLSAYADGIRPGVQVRQGQVIGYVGSTGWSTGPHLHFAIRLNGAFVDPVKYLASKGIRI